MIFQLFLVMFLSVVEAHYEGGSQQDTKYDWQKCHEAKQHYCKNNATCLVGTPKFQKRSLILLGILKKISKPSGNFRRHNWWEERKKIYCKCPEEYVGLTCELLKCNKPKCDGECTSINFYGKEICWYAPRTNITTTKGPVHSTTTKVTNLVSIQSLTTPKTTTARSKETMKVSTDPVTLTTTTKCPPGYYGEGCGKYQCEPLRCNYGACEIQEPYTGKPKCICWPGVKGYDCSECDSNVPYCENGGTCQDGEPFWTVQCQCPAGFSGNRCEEGLLTVTTKQPVTNSTTNIAVVTHDKTTAFDDFTTTASPQSTEESTMTPMNACSIKCQNGGTCVVDDADEECKCLSGFTGASCELKPCSASPCINNGSCRINQTGYTCDCPSDYGGKNCETPKFCSHCEKKGIRSSVVAGSSCTSYRVGEDIFHCPKGLNFDPNFCGCVISPIATACEC